MKKFFSSDLKKRGWSNAMIHSLLPKPIEEPNPYIPTKTVKFWNADDVQKVENSDAFKNYKNALEHFWEEYARILNEWNEINKKEQEILTDLINLLKERLSNDKSKEMYNAWLLSPLCFPFDRKKNANPRNQSSRNERQ